MSSDHQIYIPAPCKSVSDKGWLLMRCQGCNKCIHSCPNVSCESPSGTYHLYIRCLWSLRWLPNVGWLCLLYQLPWRHTVYIPMIIDVCLFECDERVYHCLILLNGAAWKCSECFYIMSMLTSNHRDDDDDGACCVVLNERKQLSSLALISSDHNTQWTIERENGKLIDGAAL